MNLNFLHKTNSFSEKKIIYYYQTMKSLDPLIQTKLDHVYIYVSSIHFGFDNKKMYIHLNNTSPYDQKQVWNNLKKAHEHNMTILLMIGGAGGGFRSLFTNYKQGYSLLKSLINTYPFIQGIDLDIEEPVYLQDVLNLIQDISNDFGSDFIISLSPVQNSLISDEPGMGGFSYKTLTKNTTHIHWLNVQAYGDYSLTSYQQIIQNGYKPQNLVYGMLGDELQPSTFNNYSKELSKIIYTYPTMGGVFLWEYGDTYINPIEWGKQMYQILYNNILYNGLSKIKYFINELYNIDMKSYVYDIYEYYFY